MTRIGPGFTAVVLLALCGAGPALGQSVSGSCAGSTDANGNFTSASAGGCDPTPQPAASGSGYTAAQQMQLDAAQNVGAAIGSAFVNWLLAPPAHHDNQRALQQARQRLFQQQQRQDAERARHQAEVGQVLGAMKGTEYSSDLAMKGEGDAGALSAQDSQTLESLKHQVRALDCGMAGMYSLTETLGPEGKAFSAGLADDVLAAERQLPQARTAAGACEVFSFSRDSMSQASKTQGAHGGAQMQVQVTGTRFGDTGQMVLTINYELSKTGVAPSTGQSVIVLNAAGKVDCEDVTPDTAGCLKRAGMAGGIFSGKRYCPRPPPDNFARKNYSACATQAAADASAPSSQALPLK